MASSSQRDTKLSKTLSWILRHGATKVGINLDSEGFASVEQLLALQNLRGFNLEDIRCVVENNSKQRFSLKQNDSKNWIIRANQGHTITVENLELTPIVDASEFPVVVHGTFWKNWPSIKSSGLSRMKRQHIHLAPGMPGENQVISGMRASCDLWIFVNLELALKDGLEFFLSSNRVILCPGDSNGYLAPKYFRNVTRKQQVL